MVILTLLIAISISVLVMLCLCGSETLLVEISVRTRRKINYKYSTNNKQKRRTRDLTRFDNLPASSGQKWEDLIQYVKFFHVTIDLKGSNIYSQRKETQSPRIWVKYKYRIQPKSESKFRSNSSSLLQSFQKFWDQLLKAALLAQSPSL